MTYACWGPEARDKVIKKLAKEGQVMPEGIKARGWWFDLVGNRTFALYEADDIQAITTMHLPWTDLCEMEAFPVMEVQGVMEAISK
jgi:hypothetical protein